MIFTNGNGGKAEWSCFLEVPPSPTAGCGSHVVLFLFQVIFNMICQGGNNLVKNFIVAPFYRSGWVQLATMRAKLRAKR